MLSAGIEYSHPAMMFDLTASIAQITGVKSPRPFDGVDILKFVAAQESPPARTLFWRQRRGDRTWRGVRDGSLKYVSETRGDKRQEFLFDLAADESEQKNLLESRRDDVVRMTGLLSQWEVDVKHSR